VEHYNGYSHGYGYLMGQNSCTRTRTHGCTHAKPALIPIPVQYTRHSQGSLECSLWISSGQILNENCSPRLLGLLLHVPLQSYHLFNQLHCQLYVSIIMPYSLSEFILASHETVMMICIAVFSPQDALLSSLSLSMVMGVQIAGLPY
jgi:hypothetical protein